MNKNSPTSNKFEFVLLAGARARQLQRGCIPRTAGSDKPARLAALEVLQGHVVKLPEPIED